MYQLMYIKKTNLYGLLKMISITTFYIIIVLTCYPGLFLNFTSGIIRGEMGDLRNIIGIISHSINVPIDQLYHLPIFYPESYLLTKTHPLFGISLFIKAFRIAGLNLIGSINLYIIFSLVAGAWGTFLLAKEFVKKWFFPLLFSTIYILHPMNHLHFVWINFLSRFYIPFIVLFLIRFFITRKKIYAVLVAILSVLQFMASIYYGVLLWVLLIPSFIFFQIILTKKHRENRKGLINWLRMIYKRIKSLLPFLLFCLIIGALLILLVFHPYISQNSSTIKKYDGKLTQVEEIFSVSKIAAIFLGDHGEIGQYLFPGLLFSTFVLLFFVSRLNRLKIFIGTILITLLIIMCFLVYFDWNILNLVFYVFLTILLLIIISGWSQTDHLERTLFLVLITLSSFLFHFTYPGFLQNFAPYKFLHLILPVGGLTVIKRTYLMLLPLFAVLASIGAQRVIGDTFLHIDFPFLKKLNPRYLFNLKSFKIVIFILLFLILFLENVRNPLRYLNMPSIPAQQEIYSHLPFSNNEVVLEIPFYFRRRLKNAYYMINRRFHQNYLINGKTSLLPRKYYRKLMSNIGKFQQKFPNNEGIKRLLHDYSVSYIIIHIDLLKQYQSYQRVPTPLKVLKERILKLNHYLNIVYEDSSHILIKVKERFPLSKLIRTYSYYHLKNHVIKIKLKKKYNGIVKLRLNGKFIKQIKCNSSVVLINLQNSKLTISPNKVELNFDREIHLQ